MRIPRLADLLADGPPRFMTVSADIHMTEVASAMVQEGHTVVAVLSQGKLLGLLTQADIMRRLVQVAVHQSSDQPISMGLAKPITTARPQTTLTEALELMEANQLDHLPVMDRENLLGIVPAHALMKTLLESLYNEYRHLQEYIDHLHQAGQD